MEQHALGPVLATAANYMTEHDWTTHREQITRLYRDENSTLKDTMKTIEQKHGVKATANMYKKRITKWGLDRKKKKDEVLAMLRKKTERDAIGKKTTFKLRDRHVDFTDVQKYARRNRISEADIAELIASHPQTPPDLRCLTPEPVPSYVSMGGACHSQERILLDLKTYVIGSFEQKAWQPLPDDLGILFRGQTTANHNMAGRALVHFIGAMKTVRNLLKMGGQQEAVLHLSSACSVVGDLVRVASFLELIHCFGLFHLIEDEQAVSIVSRCFLDMATLILPVGDPRRQLYCALARLARDQLAELYPALRQLLADQQEHLIGEYNYSTIIERVHALDVNGSVKARRDWLCQMLSKLEDAFGALDKRSIYVLTQKAWAAYHMSDDATAEVECRQALRLLTLCTDQRYSIMHSNTLSLLTSIQHAQGNYIEAIASLKSALTTFDSELGNRGMVCNILSHLERLTRHVGNVREAEQIRVRRRALLIQDQVALD